MGELSLFARRRGYGWSPLRITLAPCTHAVSACAGSSRPTGRSSMNRRACSGGAHHRRGVDGQATRLFRYFETGSLATISRSVGVAVIRGLHLSGFVAWLAWLFVHVFFLIGFRNRIFVLSSGRGPTSPTSCLPC